MLHFGFESDFDPVLYVDQLQKIIYTELIMNKKVNSLYNKLTIDLIFRNF